MTEGKLRVKTDRTTMAAGCCSEIKTRKRYWSCWAPCWMSISIMSARFIASALRLAPPHGSYPSSSKYQYRCTSRRLRWSASLRQTPSVESNVDIEQDAKNSLLPWFRVYYNDVYEVPLPPNHRFPMQKYRLVRKMLQAKIPSLKCESKRVDCEFVVSPLATVDELVTTHDPRYVDRFVRGLQAPEEIRGVGLPWSPQGVKRALSSTGGTVAAACAAVEETLLRRRRQNWQRGELAPARSSSAGKGPIAPCWAAHVAGGTHHAFWDRGEGFCVFSDIAVAANVVRERYKDHVRRILILDLDVHQGNGNAVLFRDRPDVFTFSMHCSSNYFSSPRQSDVDVELPPGSMDDTYLITLHHWLQTLRRHWEFELVFYQAGVDVLECDRLGKLKLSSRGVERRDRMVYDLCLEMCVPLVITMGGGYPKRHGAWAPILDAHCNVYWQAHQALANWCLSRWPDSD